MPHAALWVVQRFIIDMTKCGEMGFNAARGFVGGAAIMKIMIKVLGAVSMPHAALWVVQPPSCERKAGGQGVSMPHAALWVVQLRRSQPLSP